MLGVAAVLAALSWGFLLLAPAQPWRNRERLSALASGCHDLGDVTVLIAARDEAALLPGTLRALAAQGDGLRVVVVDDRSRDATAQRARETLREGLTVIEGRALPAGWSGKVWAQHQGEPHLDRTLTLLLDADIELSPGMLAALRRKLCDDELAMVSVMARLPTRGGWERLLVPPFIFFFKLLYPFALANRPDSAVAAAAGGCVLLRTECLREAGGFEALRDAVIDDCTLARHVKRLGRRIWIGLSDGAIGRRPYAGLRPLWDMVARTAFTQLGYSPLMLVGCTLAMGLAFAVPLAALASADAWAVAAGTLAVGLMAVSFLPTLRLLEVPVAWALTLPFAALLFLAMTWTSALRYWRGERSRWRGRHYPRGAFGG
jgi:hopene-associated glycosyltransferase HpnB